MCRRILVGHFSVNEASHGSEQNIMIGRDAAIPCSILAYLAFRYVALGHIHKHQSLNTDLQLPVLYSGSIERIDFGEEHEPKGFIVVEIGDGPTTWEFVRGYQRQARPFVTVRGRRAGRGRSHRGGCRGDQRTRRSFGDGRARSVAKLHQAQEALVVEREIIRALEGAYFVASLQKEIERTERQRLGAVSVEALTPAELLERYLQVKEVPAERAKLLLAHGEAFIEMVDGGSAS